jgi:ABC-type uncharacterized transport system permease subunit
MTQVLSTLTFTAALVLYGAASGLFFFEIAPHKSATPAPLAAGLKPPPPSLSARLAPKLLGAGALGHAAYVTLASMVEHVCPVHSIHFLLSALSLAAIGAYLALRTRLRIHALGLLVGPLGLAFLLGTFFLGAPGPEPRLSPIFIAAHVLANLLGVALFLLAGGAAALYLVAERRIKQKHRVKGRATLPALDTLDQAVHRFLVLGFPLLTLGIVTGTIWAKRLEMGSAEEVMRIVLGYATWLLIAMVLLLRVAAGWRGRRAAYGTIAGLGCALAVLALYLVRPAAPARRGGATPAGGPASSLVEGAPAHRLATPTELPRPASHASAT